MNQDFILQVATSLEKSPFVSTEDFTQICATFPTFRSAFCNAADTTSADLDKLLHSGKLRTKTFNMLFTGLLNGDIRWTL